MLFLSGSMVFVILVFSWMSVEQINSQQKGATISASIMVENRPANLTCIIDDPCDVIWNVDSSRTHVQCDTEYARYRITPQCHINGNIHVLSISAVPQSLHETEWICYCSHIPRSNTLKLIVNIPVKKVVVVPVRPSVNEGKKKEFTCYIPDYPRPAAIFEWFREYWEPESANRRMETISENITDSSTASQSVLHLYPTRNDKRVICKSKNEFNNDWVSATSELDVIYPPSAIEFNTSATRYNKITGDYLDNIECSADCNPECTIQWIMAVSQTQARHIYSGTLSLGNLSKYDNGTYWCIAKNIYPALRKSLDILVLYPPVVDIRHKEATENESSATLNCTASAGNPDMYRFLEWRHKWPNSTAWEFTGTKTIGGNSLILPRSGNMLTYQDSGYYTCIVSNDPLDKNRKRLRGKNRIEFIVRSRPVLVKTTKVFGIKVGQTHNLSPVTFFNNSDDVTLVWYKQDSRLLSEGFTRTIEPVSIELPVYDKIVHTDGFEVVLGFKNFSVSDVGSYTLLLRNKVGEIRHSFLITTPDKLPTNPRDVSNPPLLSIILPCVLILVLVLVACLVIVICIVKRRRNTRTRLGKNADGGVNGVDVAAPLHGNVESTNVGESESAVIYSVINKTKKEQAPLLQQGVVYGNVMERPQHQAQQETGDVYENSDAAKPVRSRNPDGLVYIDIAFTSANKTPAAEAEQASIIVGNDNTTTYTSIDLLAKAPPDENTESDG